MFVPVVLRLFKLVNFILETLQFKSTLFVKFNDVWLLDVLKRMMYCELCIVCGVIYRLSVAISCVVYEHCLWMLLNNTAHSNIKTMSD